MALSKTIPTPYGDAGYHVVQQLEVARIPALSTTVTVASYRDAAHRHTEGAQPLATWSFPWGAENGLDPLGDNLISQSYAQVKAQAYWEGATDA